MPGNSNWFEWQWPTSGDFEGCILAWSIPNLRSWTTFTPTQLEKLQKCEIEKPNPNISTPTISNSNWEIPPPNSERMYHGNYFDSLLLHKISHLHFFTFNFVSFILFIFFLAIG